MKLGISAIFLILLGVLLWTVLGTTTEEVQVESRREITRMPQIAESSMSSPTRTSEPERMPSSAGDPSTDPGKRRGLEELILETAQGDMAPAELLRVLSPFLDLKTASTESSPGIRTFTLRGAPAGSRALLRFEESQRGDDGLGLRKVSLEIRLGSPADNLEGIPRKPLSLTVDLSRDRQGRPGILSMRTSIEPDEARAAKAGLNLDVMDYGVGSSAVFFMSEGQSRAFHQASSRGVIRPRLLGVKAIPKEELDEFARRFLLLGQKAGN